MLQNAFMLSTYIDFLLHHVIDWTPHSLAADPFSPLPDYADPLHRPTECCDSDQEIEPVLSYELSSGGGSVESADSCSIKENSSVDSNAVVVADNNAFTSSESKFLQLKIDTRSPID